MWRPAPTDEALTLDELTERLGVPVEDLARTLHSLSCAKYKVLLKSPPGRTVAKGDVFTVNRKFQDKMRRIKARRRCWAPRHRGCRATYLT